MKFPQTQALYAYWLQRCGGRCAPDRYDLDPAEMRGVLPYTFMLDVDPTPFGARYPIRLSGTRLDAIFGRDLRGCDFPGLLAEGDRSRMSVLLAGMLDGAQPMVAGLTGAPEGYPQMAFELLVLPLRHHGRTHERVLCSLVPSGTPGWIGLKPVETFSLSSWRFVDRRAEPARVAASAAMQRPRLKLIQGGRVSAPSVVVSQSRVKASVAQSGDMFLVTRRS